MTTGAGDPLFGRDGTDGAGVGPLPGFELPVVRLPSVGPDGEIRGLDDFDADLEAGPAVRPVGSPEAFRSAAPGGPLADASSAPGAPVPPGAPALGPVPWSVPDRAPGSGVPPRPPARPPVVDEPGILGLSRRSRSRLGSRLFTAFFVLVFAVILVQMIVALLTA